MKLLEYALSSVIASIVLVVLKGKLDDFFLKLSRDLLRVKARKKLFAKSSFLPVLLGLESSLKVEPESTVKLTLGAISKMNGLTQDTPIYIALNKHVYDVSKGRNKFGPRKKFHALAGHDASRAFAIKCFSKKCVDGSITGLSKRQLKELDRWDEYFYHNEKYEFVGWLVDELASAIDTEASYSYAGTPEVIIDLLSKQEAKAQVIPQTYSDEHLQVSPQEISKHAEFENNAAIKQQQSDQDQSAAHLLEQETLLRAVEDITLHDAILHQSELDQSAELLSEQETELRAGEEATQFESVTHQSEHAESASLLSQQVTQLKAGEVTTSQEPTKHESEPDNSAALLSEQESEIRVGEEAIILEPIKNQSEHDQSAALFSEQETLLRAGEESTPHYSATHQSELNQPSAILLEQETLLRAGVEAIPHDSAVHQSELVQSAALLSEQVNPLRVGDEATPHESVTYQTEHAEGAALLSERVNQLKAGEEATVSLRISDQNASINSQDRLGSERQMERLQGEAGPLQGDTQVATETDAIMSSRVTDEAIKQNLLKADTVKHNQAIEQQPPQIEQSQPEQITANSNTHEDITVTNEAMENRLKKMKRDQEQEQLSMERRVEEQKLVEQLEKAQRMAEARLQAERIQKQQIDNLRREEQFELELELIESIRRAEYEAEVKARGQQQIQAEQSSRVEEASSKTALNQQQNQIDVLARWKRMNAAASGNGVEPQPTQQ